MIELAEAVGARIREQAGGLFAFVGTIADFEALGSIPRRLPAAYILPLGERATANETFGRNVQAHDCDIGVLLMVKHANDASGERALTALQPLREAVQAAIVGWSPEPESGGTVQFDAGLLVDFIDNTTLWRDQFSLRRFITRG